MKKQGKRGFFEGMLLGAALSLVAGLLALYLLTILDLVSVSILETPRIQVLAEWIRRNLGLSVIPFGLTLALYLHSLRALSHSLGQDGSQETIAQQEHLLDVWTSLFFGIGVIWTAIGMRSALLYALGDPAVTAQSGAFTILQRLVDGGILTALTTTIMGGVGGYLMRVVKSSLLGTRLSRYYDRQEREHADRIEDLLRGIHASVGSLAACTPAVSDDGTRGS
jgi:hypothetical protein